MRDIKVMMGLVALGVGQITAQQQSNVVRWTEPDGSVTSMAFYEWPNKPIAPSGMTQWTEPDGSSSSLSTRQWSNKKTISPQVSRGGTFITTAKLSVKGRTTVWSCIDPTLPPGAVGGCVANEPPTNGGCDPWQTRFITSFVGVPCPPTGPLTFRFYVMRSDSLGFREVGRWDVSFPPPGNCTKGYQSNFSGTVSVPDCGGTTPTPTPTPTSTPTPTPPPLPDEDFGFSGSAGEDCQGQVYNTWAYGPWPFDVAVHITAHVDDDIRVNGVILDQGAYAFNSGRSLPCDGVANGEHDSVTSFTLSSGSPITIELINNFASSVSVQGHIKVTEVLNAP